MFEPVYRIRGILQLLIGCGNWGVKVISEYINEDTISYWRLKINLNI